MDKGVRPRNDYYFLDFYHMGTRHRIYTTLTDSPENKPKAIKLLAMLKIDLERNQFYTENYKFKLQNVNALEKLDPNFKTNQHNISVNHLINEQIERYKKMVENGNLAVSTFDGYCYAINLHLIPYFKNVELSKIDVTMLEDFITHIPFCKLDKN